VRRPIRLRDDRDDLVMAQERLESRQRERRGPIEENLHAK
jgi:hypothetical protein